MNIQYSPYTTGRRSGVSIYQAAAFLNMVRNGQNPAYFGKDVVVISAKYFRELTNPKTEIILDEL